MSAGLNRVELAGDLGREALRIGGHAVACTAAMLRVAAGCVPALTVDLPVAGGVVVTLDATAEVAGPTRAALIAMGWTPPPAEPAIAAGEPAGRALAAGRGGDEVRDLKDVLP
jgi:hypothetical protein